jgi:hypothetical protein
MVIAEGCFSLIWLVARYAFRRPLSEAMGCDFTLVVWRAEGIAILLPFATACVGAVICAGCIRAKAEIPKVLLYITLGAFLVSVCSLVLFPAHGSA